MRPKSPVRGERSSSTSSNVVPPRRSTGYQNRNGPTPYDSRQVSFRPLRHQPPPLQPSRTNGPEPAAVPLPLYNSTWGNVPPRMLPSNMGRQPDDASFALHQMTAELNAMQNGLYQHSIVEARFLPPTPPDVWTSPGYQSYLPPSRQQPMPRFQQYPSNIDQEYNSSTLRSAEQSIYPPYGTLNPPFQTPPIMQAAFNGHPTTSSFVYSHNGHYYNSEPATSGQPGFLEHVSQRGYQQWPR